MKLVIFAIIAVLGTSSALQWENYKALYTRNYSNTREELLRKQIFQKNIEKIVTHNEKFKKGLVNYTLGINQFTDMTPEEIKPYTHGVVKPAVNPRILPNPYIPISSRADLGLTENMTRLETLDWRDFGVVSRVKNQGQCGSCWAFSSTGAIEAQLRLAYGADYEMYVSEQQLVDCVKENFGCSGGWMNYAFDYVAKNSGLDYEQAYPYEAEQGACRFQKDKIGARLSGLAYLSYVSEPDEELLADMVASRGPVAMAIDAGGDFAYYSGGIYYNPECDTNTFTHAMLIVGYGTENGQDYWLVKNSWGDSWGDNGYIKMARNRNNHCGIAGAASVPIL